MACQLAEEEETKTIKWHRVGRLCGIVCHDVVIVGVWIPRIHPYLSHRYL